MVPGPCSPHLRPPWKGADAYGGGVTVFVIHGVMALCSCDCEHPTHVCSPPSHTPTSKSTELKEIFLPPCRRPQVSASWEELADVAGCRLVIIPWDVSLLSGVCAPYHWMVDLGKAAGQLGGPARLLSAQLWLPLLNMFSWHPLSDSAVFWNESGIGLTLIEHVALQRR